MALHTISLFINRAFWPVLIGLILILVLPREQRVWRFIIYAFLFTILRDLMVPLGLLFLGRDGFMWLRPGGTTGIWLFLWIGTLAFITLILWKESWAYIKTELGDWNWQALPGVLIGGLLALPRVFDSYTPSQVRMQPDATDAILWLLLCLTVGGLLSLTFYTYIMEKLQRAIGTRKWLVYLAMGCLVSLSVASLATTINDLGFNIYAYFFAVGALLAYVRHRLGLTATILTLGSGLFYLTIDGLPLL